MDKRFMKTREVEENMARLFSTCSPFSEHMKKWEDDALPDKYDNNCFEYSGQPTEDEFRSALDDQRKKGASFIKLEGDEPLADSFGMDEEITLTMLHKGPAEGWHINDRLAFGTPAMEELKEIELKHYGKLYGEDFTRRNVERRHEKQLYHGAYLDGRLVGTCFSYTDREHGLTCVDGLLVDREHRGRYIATSLLAYVKEMYPDTDLFLHAEEDDTPKEMYLKLGFQVVDRLYEYLSTDIERTFLTVPIRDNDI